MLHAHDHPHSHAVAPAIRRERRLLFAFALTLVTLIAEAVGGWLSGSLALLADAGHMLVDAAALLFAWLAAHFASRPADARRSFGYARLEVLVGYTNSLAQFVLVAWIAVEAVGRFLAPAEILSGLMLAVAFAGLVVNAVVLRVLGGHDAHDVNTASARLHVLGDLLGSLGAVAAALVIRYFGWTPADALISLAVSALILGGAWRLLRRSSHILLEGTPEGVEGALIASAVEEAGVEVSDVHHVHVWELSGGSAIATLHARLVEGANADAAIVSVQRVLHERFGIRHATVQLELRGCADHDSGRGGC